MKITDVRARVVECRGNAVPPQPHFCTNPMDLLDLPVDTMGSFRFHSWLVVEVIRQNALTGNFGDGKFFIYNDEGVVKIRAGEKGESAI